MSLKPIRSSEALLGKLSMLDLDPSSLAISPWRLASSGGNPFVTNSFGLHKSPWRLALSGGNPFIANSFGLLNLIFSSLYGY
jgi:hypothetical protein